MIIIAYEIRRLENEKAKCPRCLGRTVKGGKSTNGNIRRVCRDCGYQYVENRKCNTVEELKLKIKKNEAAILKLKELAHGNQL